MTTRLCINPTERYAIVWSDAELESRQHAYYWITPASMRRLLQVTSSTAWRVTHRAGDELFIEEQPYGVYYTSCAGHQAIRIQQDGGYIVAFAINNTGDSLYKRLCCAGGNV